MAEFCKKCFIETHAPTEEEIANIYMSEDEDYCEGCMTLGKYVETVVGVPRDNFELPKKEIKTCTKDYIF